MKPVRLVTCPRRCGWSASMETRASGPQVRAIAEHLRHCRIVRAEDNRRRQRELDLGGGR
jgi:hypothetical protein